MEAVEYYKERRRDKPPDFFPIDINNTGFFDINLQFKAPFIKVQSQPFEKLGSAIIPSIPIPISFFPQLPKKKVVLSSWCAGFTGMGWLKEFKEIEQLIHKYHGIVAQTWCIRNWELLSPLPQKMEYFFGSSIDNLEKTINEQDIKKHAYIGWVVIAYKQIVYVLSGQMNNILNMNVYLPYIPKSNLFVSRSKSGIGVTPQNLWFSEIQGKNVFEHSEIKYWSPDYPTNDLLEAQPTARIIGYMGSPSESDTFKIKGLHILEIEEDCKEIFKTRGSEYGEILSSFVPNIIPAYVGSKLIKGDEKDEIKLTHLRMDVQWFPDISSLVHLINIDAGIYQI